VLPPGARLPSVRECARRHGVSPTTVVAAYDRLLARGLIEARRQRGFYVREPRGATSRAPAAAPVQRQAPIDATALIRGMFARPRGAPLAPGLGTLPTTWLDASLLQSALRRALTQGADDLALQYGEPAGDLRLRLALSARLAEIGVNAPSTQIVSTLGATHALDLISRALLQPGDAVLVDEPGWAIEYARLTQLGMHLLPVPRGPLGPDLAVMRAMIESHRPRIYVTVSVLHNPTGATISLSHAHQVLMLAREHDFIIVEDDTYAHLAPAHAPRLAALDDLQRTVYVSGFSKIIAPGWRVGFVATRPDLVERIIGTKLLSTLSTPVLLERAVAICLELGTLRRHAERVTARLDAARTRSVRLAVDSGCNFVAPPQGLFGWLDVGVDTDRLAQTMHEDGWLLAPGSLFHVPQRATSLMRINFATTQEAHFWRQLVKARRMSM